MWKWGVIMLVMGGLLDTGEHALIAQNAYLDSLKVAYESEPTDTGKIILARRIAWGSMRVDLGQAGRFTDHIIRLATEVKDTFQMACGTHYLGLIARFESRFADAIPHFNEALVLHKQVLRDSMNLTGTLFNLSVCYQELGDYDRSMEYLLQELKINEDNDADRSISNSLNTLGALHKKMKHYEQARSAFSQCLDLARKNQDTITQTLALHNTAGLFIELDQLDSAMAYNSRSLRLNQQMKDEWGLAYDYNRRGEILMLLDKDEEAKVAIRQALRYARQIGNTNTELSSLEQLGQIAYQQGRYNEAAKICDQILEDKSREMSLLGTITTRRLRSKVYRAQGRTLAAWEELNKVLELSDSNYQEEISEQVRNLEMRYNVRAKEREIVNLAELNEAKTEALRKTRRNQNLLFAGLGLLLFTIVLLVRIYQLRLLARKLQLGEEQAKVERLEKEREVYALNSLIEGQERERTRIARDLHDSIGGMMSTIKSHLQSLKTDLTSHYSKTVELIDNASEEVRRISHAMVPASLQVLGLRSAVTDLGQHLENDHLVVDVEIAGGDQQLAPDRATMVFRIIQELVQNVVKHANATHLLIQLFYSDDTLQILVEDNGVGFDLEAVSDGIGLTGVQSRVEYLNGALEMVSSPGEGASIHINIPLHQVNGAYAEN